LAECHSRHGASHSYFVDQYVDAAALAHLSHAILSAGITCRFHIMAHPAGDYGRDVLEQAFAAGCRWISWGLESGSQRLVDLVRKGATVDGAERLLRDSHAVGISNLAMMIFGLPTSTPDDLDMTFAFLDRVYPFLDAMTASNFVLFGNTPFGHDPGRYGMKTLGREELVRIDGKPVHSTRLRFSRAEEDGRFPSDLGRREVDLWRRRRAWMGGAPFLEELSCEHYLIHAARRAEQGGAPVRPFNPFNPFTPPAPPMPPRRRAS
jgi:radical SAM superfamily enzyme YgiQ (UPF0313 family)